MSSVSVVIPTFNGVSLLKKHLPAVVAAMRSGDELCIIDDASSDESVQWLRQEYSSKWEERHTLHLDVFVGEKNIGKKNIVIKLLVNKTNQRYAASVNRAVLQTAHEYIFLLNNDVSPEKKSLSTLVEFFDKQQADGVDMFAVGCLEYEGKDKKADKSGKNKLWFERGMFMHSKAADMKTGETAWVSGGSGLFSKEKWLALNGFDTQFYPAYWEDVDLSFRARKQGWGVWFCADAVVFHQHESTNASVFKKQEIQNLSWSHAVYFTKKHARFMQKLAFSIWQPYWKLQRMRSTS